MASTITSEVLASVGTIVVSSFDDERAIRFSYNSERGKKVMEILAFIGFECNLYTFLVYSELKSLEEMIFRSIEMRDYLLNVTDRISIMLSVDDVSINGLIDCVIKGFLQNRPSSFTTEKDSNQCKTLINHNLMSAFHIRETELTPLLRDNVWLVYLIIYHLFFSQSTLCGELAALVNAQERAR